MISPHLSEPAKHLVDYSIGAAGVAFFLQLLPIISGVLAVALITLRIVIGVQEWKINNRKLRSDK